MRVDIYITSKFHGKIAEENGVYAVLLDTVLRGKHYRKLHIAGWNGLSFQKLAVRAAVEGIQYMTTPSEVVIHADSPYAVNVMQSGKADGRKYEELWNTYFETAARMKSVEVIFEKEHEYRTRLLERIAKGGYPVVKDR